MQVARSAPSLGSFDNILPTLAVQAKNRLIQERPDLHQQISAVVDDIAFKLIARRNDLDTDIARVWARNFTDDELKAVNAFFTSDAGKKYKAVAPGVASDILKASQNWADRLGAEMYDRALTEMKKQVADF
jgi:hypothetical protein